MGGGRSDDKGTKKEEEKENLYRKREFSHPRKLAKMAGLDPPREKMFVAEHDGKFPHTDRVINSFCSGLTAFGLISVFTTVIYFVFLYPRIVYMEEYNQY